MAEATAQVDPGGRQQIAGRGQGQQLGDAQQAASREFTAGRQPARPRSEACGEGPHQHHQAQGVAHLEGPLIAKVQALEAGAAEGKPAQPGHRG